MTYSPKVSVIVSVYNGEAYLQKCVESLQAQDLDALEIICVDDGSHDATPDILARACRQDQRFRVVRHETNRGLGATRNTGIAEARAPYVGAVDADDYVAPNMFSQLLEGTANGYYDIVACGFARVDAFGTVLSRSMENRCSLENIQANVNIFSMVNPSFWNKIWRRSLFIENNISFPEKLFYEDAATTPFVLLYAKSLNMIGGTPYMYVQRPGSIINSFGDRHIIEYLRVLDVVKEGLEYRGVYSKHKKNFDRYVTSQFNYLAQNVAGNPNISLQKKLNHMRHINIISKAYIAYDDLLREKVE